MPLPTERAARVHAEALYAVYGGVDLWDESRRIALMMEESSSTTNAKALRPS